MKRNDIEFEVGQRVTFKPYEKAIPAVVKAVDVPNMVLGVPGGRDERVFYQLTGADSTALVTTSTGKSIVESKYYDPEPFTFYA